MIKAHDSHDQFDFKNRNTFKTESYQFYRSNRFAKDMINNRHDLKMSKHNNAGYGYVIFNGIHPAGLVWFLNQVTSNYTYIRVSRYESMSHDNFIAVLSELSDYFNEHGYTLILKTCLPYAQSILNKNFVGKLSKASHSKRGANDRSTKDVSVDGITYDLSVRKPTFKKWFKHGAIEA